MAKTKGLSVVPKDPFGCPYLFLAPMEGVGDRPFRKAMAGIGGFDEAVTEFLRVPRNAHVESLSERYVAAELFPIPLAAQIMGGEWELMAAMAKELEKRGAPRIDLNCGCPSNTVTGRGAGSSLLKEPKTLHDIAKAMVSAVNVPVSIKMRSGFDDISLFKENLKAAEESGVSFITLHPRTKVDGYGPPARWDLIAEAKSILKVPLVGNGDILTREDALKMLKETKCDALMIGRGAVINPLIFHEIRAVFNPEHQVENGFVVERFFDVFVKELYEDSSIRTKINKCKQIMSFMFKKNEALQEKRQEMLKIQETTVEGFISQATRLMKV